MTRSPSPACRAHLERLSRYVDGDLPPRTRMGTVGHLAHCPCCRDVVDSLQRTLGLCHAERRRPLPSAVRARARARIAQLLAPRDGGRRPR